MALSSSDYKQSFTAISGQTKFDFTLSYFDTTDIKIGKFSPGMHIPVEDMKNFKNSFIAINFSKKLLFTLLFRFFRSIYKFQIFSEIIFIYKIFKMIYY